MDIDPETIEISLVNKPIEDIEQSIEEIKEPGIHSVEEEKREVLLKNYATGGDEVIFTIKEVEMEEEDKEDIN